MESFVLHIPTKIIFGKDVIQGLGEETVKYGKRALLVYGRSSIKKYGTYDKVVTSLKNKNIQVIEHGGVQPNPTTLHANEGIKKAKQSNVDIIIAVGGGSAMDEAKVIAIGAKTNKDIWDFFDKKAEVEDALPVITVVTMPATSSEMNYYTVLTNSENRRKVGLRSEHIFPKVSFLDPSITTTIPVKGTAHACSDILSHMFEVYFNSQEEFNPVNDGLIEGNCKAIMQSMNRILKNPKDYDARANIMWGAALAWNTTFKSGVKGAETICHKLEHPLSGIYDIAHGAGLSIVTPAWLKYTKDRIGNRIIKFGENILGICEGTRQEKINKSIEGLISWYKRIGTPTTFKEAGIDSPDIQTLADHVMEGILSTNVEGYSRDDIINIFNMCL